MVSCKTAGSVGGAFPCHSSLPLSSITYCALGFGSGGENQYVRVRNRIILRPFMPAYYVCLEDQKTDEEM